MPEPAERNQDLLTQPSGSWESQAALWGASDVFTPGSFRTVTQGYVTVPPPDVTVVVHVRQGDQRTVSSGDFPTPPDAIKEAIRRASELVQLPSGWNSYDAKPVSREAAQAAITFLVETASATPTVAAPAVVPTVRGGLQLEWHRQGIDLEVEFEPDAKCSWCAEDQRTEESYEEPLLSDVAALQHWLGRASG